MRLIALVRFASTLPAGGENTLSDDNERVVVIHYDDDVAHKFDTASAREDGDGAVSTASLQTPPFSGEGADENRASRTGMVFMKGDHRYLVTSRGSKSRQLCRPDSSVVLNIGRFYSLSNNSRLATLRDSPFSSSNNSLFTSSPLLAHSLNVRSHAALFQFRSLSVPMYTRSEVEEFDRKITPFDDSYDAALREKFISALKTFDPIAEGRSCALTTLLKHIFQLPSTRSVPTGHDENNPSEGLPNEEMFYIEWIHRTEIFAIIVEVTRSWPAECLPMLKTNNVCKNDVDAMKRMWEKKDHRSKIHLGIQIYLKSNRIVYKRRFAKKNVGDKSRRDRNKSKKKNRCSTDENASVTQTGEPVVTVEDGREDTSTAPHELLPPSTGQSVNVLETEELIAVLEDGGQNSSSAHRELVPSPTGQSANVLHTGELIAILEDGEHNSSTAVLVSLPTDAEAEQTLQQELEKLEKTRTALDA